MGQNSSAQLGQNWLAKPGLDAGYGKEPAFLRALDDAGEVFVADVHRDQRVWTEDPGLHVPAPKSGRGRPSKKLQARRDSRRRGRAGQGVRPEGVDAPNPARGHARNVAGRNRDPTRLGSGTARRPKARCWHLVVRREVGSPETIKYSLSNAPENTPLLRLAQMQGHRYWVERAFEDAKGECGMADYQALS